MEPHHHLLALMDWETSFGMMSPPPKGILGAESQQVKIGFNNMAASTKEVATSIKLVAQSLAQGATKLAEFRESLEDWGIKRIGDAFGRLLNLGCFMLWMWFLARSVEWCDGRFAKEGDIPATVSVLILMNLLLLMGCVVLYSCEVAYEERQDARKFAEREHEAKLAAEKMRGQELELHCKQTEVETDSEQEDEARNQE